MVKRIDDWIVGDYMRNVLYRGKTVKGDWIYGSLVITTTGNTKTWIVTTARGNGGWFNVMKRDYVYPKTVGQFIKEVNEQRIFEGDIVKAYMHGDLETQPFIHPIELRNGTYWFGNWTWLEFLNVMRFVEVLGNIHDKEWES